MTLRAPLLALLLLASTRLHAQQNVFNVPSPDVMEPGETDYETVISLGDESLSSAITPRTVTGLGHGIEAGFNVTSFNEPTPTGVTVVPTVKWKFYENRTHGIVLFAGDGVYLPVTQRTYTIGNSAYIAAAKTFHHTRLAVGAYDFSGRTIDTANRGGIQASLEQELNHRLTLATDWYSGDDAIGFVTTGFAWKLTHKLAILPAWQMGNHNFTRGNHAALLILAFTPQAKDKEAETR